MRLPAFLAIAGFLFILTAQAASDWQVRVWQVSDGLPDNRVTGIVQTSEGTLWIGTLGGLVRFDGLTLENFPLSTVHEIAGEGVRALHADSRDHLWLGAHREAVLSIGDDASRRHTIASGIASGQFNGFAEDGEGRIWFAFGEQICRLDGDRVCSPDWPDGSGGGGRAALARDRRGQVWCAFSQRIGFLRAGRFEQRHTLEGRDVVMAAAREGGLWICVGSRLLRMREDAPPEACIDLPEGIRPLAILEDRAGEVWIGTLDHGLFRSDGRRVERVETSHRQVGALLEDREGSIWAGTYGGGLNRLRPRVIELMGEQSGLPFESVVSVCEDAEGGLWAVAGSGQLLRGNGKAWSIVPAIDGAACVTADRQGTLWVGTRGQGLYEIRMRDGRIRIWQQRDGLPGNSIRCVLAGADNSLWFTTRNPARLGQLKGGKIRILPVPESVRTIRALVEDARGTIWIGTSDGQVLQVSGDVLVNDPALTNAHSVRCLHATPDGSLWIGYAERGIGLLREGRFARLTTTQGIPDNSIWQMASDSTGALWLASAQGLCRMELKEAMAVAEGRQPRLSTMLFSYEEGVPNAQPHYGNVPAVCQSADGRMLFSTSLGLLALTPENLRLNPAPPPVTLERVMLDDQVIALRASRFPLRGATAPGLVELGSIDPVITVPPDHRRLVLDFAALSYAAPENVRFRYRLDGFDDAWSDPVRERSVRYPRLPAGDYTFRVIASNDAGVWNKQGTALGIIVSPFFWQTGWFRGGMLAIFTAAVAAVVRFVSFQRLRARLRQAEQQASLFQERMRIARDIHDDLGGSLAHIKLLSEIAVQDHAGPGPADTHLRQIAAKTRQMLKSLDETIWAINPRNDTLPHLISFMGQHAVEFLRAAGIACHVDLPDDPPELVVASDVRHHLFLVVKEALTNVVRHSGARAVNLQATVEREILRLVIEDNGCGFDRLPDDALADGIRNMRQRMNSVGGSFQIESGRQTGTRIDLVVAVRRDI